jgi:hypothetical protein
MSEALQAMQWAGHLRAQPHKRVQANSAPGRASLSTTAEEASASNAAGKAYTSTTTEGAAASNTANTGGEHQRFLARSLRYTHSLHQHQDCMRQAAAHTPIHTHTLCIHSIGGIHTGLVH